MKPFDVVPVRLVVFFVPFFVAFLVLLAERGIVTAPDLAPKTWYGMPAYAKDDKVLCFFQSADKFKARYATLGFNDTANLDQVTCGPPTSH